MTRLGAAVRERRGDRSLVSLAVELGVTHPTLSRVENGKHQPAIATARALARWLGWTTDQVLDAAAERVP